MEAPLPLGISINWLDEATHPERKEGRKGLITMPPACVLSLPFCPKLVHVAAMTPDD